MSTFKQTLKFSMLRYPTIFPNPVDVCVHLFCAIGNGYEWYEGEMVDRFHHNEPLVMKYPLDRDMTPEMAAIHASVDARTGHKLKDQARFVQMKWTEENIDAIVDAIPTNVYFGSDPKSYYFRKGICLEHAHAFHFPEDIKKDWAEALYGFLQYWLVQLNYEYGPGRSKDDELLWWPEDIKEARKTILEARIRLYPLAHNGQTYEQGLEQSMKFLDSLKLR